MADNLRVLIEFTQCDVKKNESIKLPFETKDSKYLVRWRFVGSNSQNQNSLVSFKTFPKN